VIGITVLVLPKPLPEFLKSRRQLCRYQLSVISCQLSVISVRSRRDVALQRLYSRDVALQRLYKILPCPPCLPTLPTLPITNHQSPITNHQSPITVKANCPPERKVPSKKDVGIEMTELK
jgi:hypothetical protein